MAVIHKPLAKKPLSKDEVGKLIPRDPVIHLPSNRREVSIPDLVKSFPKIIPSADPVLCPACAEITLSALVASRDPVYRDETTGRLTKALRASPTRLAINWTDPPSSFEHYPMCRVLFFD
jgi:hypothetical protein